MAFVNELINEEDKKKIDWAKFKAWSFSIGETPVRWTIDHDKNIFLVFLGGPGRERERPEVYALCIQAEVVRIEAEIVTKGSSSNGSDVLWRILKIEIPLALNEKRSEILLIIEAAIHAHGYLFRINPINSVRIEIVAAGSHA